LQEADALAAIVDADVVLASRLTLPMIQNATRVRWVHSPAAAGILPLEELAARGIAVTNSRGIQAIPMAEHVIGGLLVLARRFDRMLAAQRERRWIQDELSTIAWPWTLYGRTMTVAGLGTIGREVACRAQAFGMHVTGIRRNPARPSPPFIERVAGPHQLDEVLQGCDVLVVSVPFVPDTDRWIGSRQLALLNRGAIVVNVSRGKVIDERALIEALQAGHLGGAVLDVFEHEPLDPMSPLWTLPNVVITPHCSGVRQDHWDDVIDLFSRNLIRFQQSEPLLNVVDCEAGY
jgi:phosphoglycerate dehydrogenase-like enzyme